MMPRPLFGTLTVVVFVLAMAAWGWVVEASVPAIHVWLVEHIGRAGIWAFFIVSGLVGFYCAYLSGKAGKPNGM